MDEVRGYLYTTLRKIGRAQHTVLWGCRGFSVCLVIILIWLGLPLSGQPSAEAASTQPTNRGLAAAEATPLPPTQQPPTPQPPTLPPSTPQPPPTRTPTSGPPLPLATRTPTSSVPRPPRINGLHVSGKYILTADNQPIRLRGVNRISGEYGCIFNFAIFDGPTDAATIQAMLNWKINVVRIPLNEDCWLDVNTAGIDRAYVGASYRNAVADYVTRLTAAGIIVILDLHWVGPGTLLADQQRPMPDRDHAPAFWLSVANTFKSNTSVIFDLFNAPYPDDNSDTTAAWTCLRDGSTSTSSCPGVGYTASGMQELLNAVRQTGATNLVLVPGVAYGGVLSRWIEFKPTDPLNPPNIAASVHIYPPDSQCSDQACWDAYLAPVAAQYPLIATEIGQDSCGHERIDPIIDWFESKQQHYLAWAWWPEPCGDSPFYGLITDYSTGAPSPGYGQGYKSRLTLGAAPPPDYGLSASVDPASAAPGQTVTITARVTSPLAGTVVVDVEVYDASGRQMFQQYFDDQQFAAGQTRAFTVQWPVPAGTAPGVYVVQVGVFDVTFETDLSYNSNAAQVVIASTPGGSTPVVSTPVVSPPVTCAPRPPVGVTAVPLGSGRLQATITTRTQPGSAANGLERIVFGTIQNGTVLLNGVPVTSGAPVSLAGATSVTFVVERQTAGLGTHVPFTVRDGCGDWPSFVGGGPGAF